MSNTYHRIFIILLTSISAISIAALSTGCEYILYENYEYTAASESLPEDVDLEGPYDVERVVDGDTLIVDIDGQRTRVRLIGINTPESVAQEEERNTEEGVIASDYVKTLMDEAGYEVWLEYDNELYDQYDRTLAYVYIDYEGEVIMLERILLEEGYAEAVVFGTNDRYYEEFCELEAEAS
ncbi:MAG: thermonuclease family protein [Saccharofermentans sp.]|nr:thermonuclease family protein [Saccharofermentans sp.]